MCIRDSFKDRLDGILYHTVQFCDNYAYEYTNLKQRLDIPLLMVETDATKQCEGQIRTRVEAFIESLKIAKGASIGKKSLKKAEDGKMYVLGIDSGSTSTNAVILNENKEIVAFDVVRTGAKSGESAERILSEILERARLKREDISLIVSTGYGRVSIPFADENVTEISCHGRGAHYFNPDAVSYTHLIKACFGEMINKMISPGIAPINGPKYGIILVMPTMILISSAYCRCRMHMSTKQIMPMISESSALPMIY